MPAFEDELIGRRDVAAGKKPGWVWRLSGVCVAIAGLPFAAPGLFLVSLGGSPYYLSFVAALTLSGILLFQGRRSGALVYMAALVATIAWAVWEVGFSFWLLLPRLDVPLALCVFLIPLLWHGLITRVAPIRAPQSFIPSLARLSRIAGILFALAIGAFAVFEASERAYSDVALNSQPSPPGSDWPHYGNTLKGQRYAPVTQLNRDNVGKLAVAWTYHTGEAGLDANSSTFEATPIKIRDTLYLCSPHNVVIALDAETGTQRWRHDPHSQLGSNAYLTCRGVSYHEASAGSGGPCPRRIIEGTGDARLLAINADTGEACADFGNDGVVDLREGMGGVKLGRYVVTSAPTVVGNLVITGGQIFERSSREPPGVVRAYDVTSGSLVWSWNPGYSESTLPLAVNVDARKGSPNAWAPPSVDEALGLIYLPTSVQKPDAWGGNRDPKGEAFSSAIVALEIATGHVRWVYQTVHHDVWDMDVGAQPTLFDLKTGSGTRPALLAATKRGDIFVLDRRTGKPIVPAPERPVPQGAPPGDWLSPTQPFSGLSFQPRALTERDMWGVTPFDQLWCRINFRQFRYEGIFTPQTDQAPGTLVHPGNYGVFSWGGVAVDESRQLLIASPNSVAFYSRLTPTDSTPTREASLKNSVIDGQPTRPPAKAFSADSDAFLSPLGIPCNAPPWGQIAAVDLKTNQTVWQRELGTTRDRAALGLAFSLGVPSLGGPIVTEGGLIFIGGAVDDYLRAFDVHTGEEVWRGRLPAGGQATPMTYMSGKSGRQFVVIAAGGHAGIGTTHGDSVVAYALPKNN